jgi:Ran GTPase-activating protein 1
MALTLPDWLSLPTLDLRGPRGALTEAHARELVAPVMDGSNVGFERVVLSTWAFSEASAAVVGEALRRLPRLRSLVAADIIAGRPEAQGLAVYRALGAALRGAGVALEELDLSDNAVGPKGVVACHELLAGNPALQRLYFKNCGISAEAARSIADEVLFRTPTQLRVLHLENNMSGGGGAIGIADVVAASPHLEDFMFASSRGTTEGGVALAGALRAAPGLRRLCLRDNSFGAPTLQALAAVLPCLPALEHLDVGDVLAKDAGAGALAAALARAPPAALRSLDVSENEVGPRGARALAAALRRLPALEAFSAHDNDFGGGAAAAAFGAALLARATPGKGRNADPLVRLNFSNCYLGCRAAVALALAAIAALPNLQLLQLEGNGVTNQGWQRIRDAVAEAGLPADAVSAVGEGEEGEGEEEQEEEEEGEGEGGGAEACPMTDEEATAAIAWVAPWAPPAAPAEPSPAELAALLASLERGTWRV